jgi:hypothetical protein
MRRPAGRRPAIRTPFAAQETGESGRRGRKYRAFADQRKCAMVAVTTAERSAMTETLA